MHWLWVAHLIAARQRHEDGGQLGGLQVDKAELRALVQEVLLQSHQLGPADAAAGLTDAGVLETQDESLFPNSILTSFIFSKI